MRSSGGTNFGLALSVVVCDELDDRLLGGAVVPRRQRVLGTSDRLTGECDQKQGEGMVEEFHGEFSLLSKGGGPCGPPARDNRMPVEIRGFGNNGTENPVMESGRFRGVCNYD